MLSACNLKSHSHDSIQSSAITVHLCVQAFIVLFQVYKSQGSPLHRGSGPGETCLFHRSMCSRQFCRIHKRIRCEVHADCCCDIAHESLPDVYRPVLQMIVLLARLSLRVLEKGLSRNERPLHKAPLGWALPLGRAALASNPAPLPLKREMQGKSRPLSHLHQNLQVSYEGFCLVNISCASCWSDVYGRNKPFNKQVFS